MSTQFNELIITGEKSKGKDKGNGLNAILVFMQDLQDFQEKLDQAMEAQSLDINKQKLQAFAKTLDGLWEDLTDFIRTARQQSGVEQTSTPPSSGQVKMPSAPSVGNLGMGKV